MRAGAKAPPPPSGDELVSWSQLYRYLDNPFDVLLFTLATLGCMGSGEYQCRRVRAPGHARAREGGPAFARLWAWRAAASQPATPLRRYGRAGIAAGP
jgi:hypothetical protein